MTLRQPISTSDPKSLEEFRNAAAGLIKSLIRARLIQEQDFLTYAEQRRWKLEDANREARTCATLLTKVKQLNEQFQQRFLTGLDSVSAPDAAAEEERLECLLAKVAGFICGDIAAAIQRATNDQPVAWLLLADWSSLSEIRDALDQLPEEGTRDSERQREECIVVDVENAVVYIDGVACGLNGSQRVKRRVAEFLVALVEADGDYRSMTDFEVKTAHIDAQPPQVMNLIESQPGAGSRIPRDRIWSR